MEDSKFNYTFDKVIDVEDESTIAARKFLGGVFSWMFVALIVSAFSAYMVTNNSVLFNLFFTPTGLSPLGIAAIFSPLAFSLIMQFGYNRMSYGTLALVFISYALIMGISLGFLFLIYTSTSFFSVFVTAAGIFGVMALAGYYTDRDLSSFGSIMYIFFIGVFIASAVNFFLGSELMSYIIAYVGAAVFIGLTAYYMQMLKRIGEGVEYGDASTKKLALMGALTLYITLINLFMMLLRIFGRRR